MYQTRLVKRLQQGLKAESYASSERHPNGAPAIKLEASIRLIQVLRSQLALVPASEKKVALTHSRLPSGLPVEYCPLHFIADMTWEGAH